MTIFFFFPTQVIMDWWVHFDPGRAAPVLLINESDSKALLTVAQHSRSHLTRATQIQDKDLL